LRGFHRIEISEIVKTGGINGVMDDMRLAEIDVLNAIDSFIAKMKALNFNAKKSVNWGGIEVKPVPYSDSGIIVYGIVEVEETTDSFKTIDSFIKENKKANKKS
jgi:hypothetical protein